ncbi:uncharacterized protein LOC126879542 [Diabrotica virgifera virgifera]|uniref:Uncharacterized protein n=1 Tax=Diabrotica virgifera virgifera TaxID=50390 RepID=A0ABM5JL33_DIAVI|nr:uncharacterized protein LOC126879542 [Diabrotica virgifera virgifera]
MELNSDGRGNPPDRGRIDDVASNMDYEVNEKQKQSEEIINININTQSKQVPITNPKNFLPDYQIFVLAVTLAGDSIDVAGQVLIKHFNILKSEVSDVLISKYIKELSVVFVELRPQLSVPGYFDINRRLLPMIFSTISTYAIIYIQIYYDKS